MKVLLLGASGLLGHNVLLRLEAEGHRVVALVRRASVRVGDGCAAEWVVRERVDEASLLDASLGCEAIVNCIGTTDMSLRRLDDYLPMNTDLCRTLVRVMERRGIGTLVHISTVDTIGFGSPQCPADEEAPIRPPFTRSLYAESKRQGEAVVMEAARRHDGWHVVVLNPGYMLGPYDAKPSSGRMLLAAYGRRWMVAPAGGKAFVHVGDVAEAAVAALTRGDHGARYIVANRHGCMDVAELYAMQARVEGYRQRVVRLPQWLLALAGGLGDAARALGVRTELSGCNVAQLGVSEHYDNRRGREALGYGETPIEEAIADFHRWRRLEKEKQRKL